MHVSCHLGHQNLTWTKSYVPEMVHSWVLGESLSSLLLRGLNMTVCVTLQTSGWHFLKQDLLREALEARSWIFVYLHRRHLLSIQSAIYFMNTMSKDEDHYLSCTIAITWGMMEQVRNELVQSEEWENFRIFYPRGLSSFTQTSALLQRLNISPHIFSYHSFIHSCMHYFIKSIITH